MPRTTLTVAERVPPPFGRRPASSKPCDLKATTTTPDRLSDRSRDPVGDGFIVRGAGGSTLQGVADSFEAAQDAAVLAELTGPETSSETRSTVEEWDPPPQF
jgi:hypothetical protein